MHPIGYCLMGRPIIYSCLELATNRVFEDNRDHMIQTFETVRKLPREGHLPRAYAAQDIRASPEGCEAHGACGSLTVNGGWCVRWQQELL